MKKFLFFFIISLSTSGQIKTGYDLIGQMHAKYYHKPCSTLAFKQKTIRPTNDTVKNTSIWTEYISFPDKLKIIFGDTANGNYTIFKNDSAFHHRANKLKRKEEDKNLIMLLLGGMYYREKDDVIKRIKDFNIDLDSLCTIKIEANEYYVIGIRNENPDKPQIWINKKTLQVEAFMEILNGNKTRVKVAERQKACDADLETKLLIYSEGKLIQEEIYYDVKLNPDLPANTFSTP